MAKGRKTGGRDFKKTDLEVFAKGGRNSALPADLKEARKARRKDVEMAMEKFMSMSREQMNDVAKNKSASAFELIVLKVIQQAIQKGDASRLSFLLDNWVGPITKRVEVEANLSHHASIVQQIEDEE